MHDHLIGTWQLNVAQSKYVPGPAPISETRRYARGPNGVEGVIIRRFADGRTDRIEYVAEYDREYPVIGTNDYDHVLLSASTLGHQKRCCRTAVVCSARPGVSSPPTAGR